MPPLADTVSVSPLTADTVPAVKPPPPSGPEPGGRGAGRARPTIATEGAGAAAGRRATGGHLVGRADVADLLGGDSVGSRRGTSNGDPIAIFTSATVSVTVLVTRVDPEVLTTTFLPSVVVTVRTEPWTLASVPTVVPLPPGPFRLPLPFVPPLVAAAVLKWVAHPGGRLRESWEFAETLEAKVPPRVSRFPECAVPILGGRACREREGC